MLLAIHFMSTPVSNKSLLLHNCKQKSRTNSIKCRSILKKNQYSHMANYMMQSHELKNKTRLKILIENQNGTCGTIAKNICI
jgi:hypothetical protein